MVVLHCERKENTLYACSDVIGIISYRYNRMMYVFSVGVTVQMECNMY